jgi:hypothetical protein
MKLPRGERAVVELKKLTEYCLDPSHPRGRHKARVFAARLGLTQSDGPHLRAALLRGAATAENAVEGLADGFGRRVCIRFRGHWAEGHRYCSDRLDPACR